MTTQVGVNVEAESHGTGARFTVEIRSDEGINLTREDAIAIVESINDTVEQRMNERFGKTPDKKEIIEKNYETDTEPAIGAPAPEPMSQANLESLIRELDYAVKTNQMPMPDEVETVHEAVDYIKAVYGITGAEAALFDAVVGGIIEDNITLSESLAEIKTDLKKAFLGKLSFLDTEKWKCIFDMEEKMQESIWSGDTSSKEKEDSEKEEISSEPNGSSKEDCDPPNANEAHIVKEVLGSIMDGLTATSREEEQRAAMRFLEALAKDGRLTEDDFGLFVKSNNFSDMKEAGAAFEKLMLTSKYCRCEKGVYPTGQTEDKSANFCEGCKKEVK